MTASSSEITSPDTVTSAQKISVVLNDDEVERIGEELLEIREPDELARRAERVLALRGLPERFAGRPQEEQQRDRELRRDQQIGQQARCRSGSAFPSMNSKVLLQLGSGASAPEPCLLSCRLSRSGAATRRHARPRSRAPACGVFFCAQTCSSSSSTIVRICGMLPRRKPFVNGSGGLFSICLIAVSAPGFFS